MLRPINDTFSSLRCVDWSAGKGGKFYLKYLYFADDISLLPLQVMDLGQMALDWETEIRSRIPVGPLHMFYLYI